MQPIADTGYHRACQPGWLHPLQHRALQLLYLHQQRVLLVVQVTQIVGREVIVELESRQTRPAACRRIRAASPRLQSSTFTVTEGRGVGVTPAPAAATTVEARQLHRRELSWRRRKHKIYFYSTSFFFSLLARRRETLSNFALGDKEQLWSNIIFFLII